MLTLGGSLRSFAEEQFIFLNTGERLRGEVMEDSNADELFISSKVLGVITVPRDAVEKMEQITPSETAVAVKEAVSGSENPTANEKQEQQLAVAKAKAETLIEKLETLEASNQTAQAEDSKPEEAPTSAEKTEADALAEQAQDEENTKMLAAALVSAENLLDTVRALEAPKSWKGNLRFGLNLYEGDTQDWTESYFRGKLEIEPPKSPNYYRFEGSYTYRETERVGQAPYKSTDRYDATFTYRRTFAENWFLQNTLGWRVDQIKGIDRELQELLGIGYKFRWEKAELLVGAGGGIEQYETNFNTTQGGESIVVNVFEEFSWDLMERTKLTQEFNYYADPENSEDYNYSLKVGVRFRFSDLLGLEFSYNKEYEGDLGNGQSRKDTQFRNSLIVYF